VDTISQLGLLLQGSETKPGEAGPKLAPAALTSAASVPGFQARLQSAICFKDPIKTCLFNCILIFTPSFLIHLFS
jgi:hypothetical protein